MKKPRECFLCELSKGCKGPVWGDGDPSSPLQWWGEAPGREEDKVGVPFVGKAGKESNTYKARYGLRLLPQYTSNVVKCRPPKNRDPKPNEIEACSYHLQQEAELIPDDCVIVTLGRFSTKAFLQEANMDMMHSIPFRHHRRPGWIVVPIFHPAVGLYDGRWMTQIDEGYRAVADVLNGIIKPEDWYDPYPKPEYVEFTGWYDRPKPDFVAVDTESGDGRTWSVQFSVVPGQAYFVSRENRDGISLLAGWAGDGVLFIMHNAQHDIPALGELGIRPGVWQDTMLIANLLGNVPRGLKALAFRLCGMQMKTYKEMVTPYDDDRVVPYLEEVASIEWANPDQVVEIRGGKRHIRNPQPLHKRAQKILNDLKKNPETKCYERWMKLPKDMRDMASTFIGPFKPSQLKDIPFEDALYYSARDPDATIRVYPKLLQRLESIGLMKVLDLDQGIVSMLSSMEQFGAAVDPSSLYDLKSHFQETKEEVLNILHSKLGYWINPGSTQQVEKLLYKELKLKKPKRKPEQESFTTAEDYIVKLDHPIVADILRYRGADKLEGAFVDRLLDMRDRQDRIHDDLSQIRTVSGRLTASIMVLIPKRGEGGRMLRNCFVCSPGNVVISADYSQIELRVLAHLSQDQGMIEVFQKGGDIHAETGYRVYGVKPESQTPDQRRAAKIVNFGIVYGLTPEGLLDKLEPFGYNLQDCDKLIRDWFKGWPGVKSFMSELYTHARRFGFVAAPSGRRCLIPEVRSSLPYIRSRGLRRAGNFPIQTTASDIIKKAMGRLYRVDFGYPVHWIIQVHDELKSEVEAQHLDNTVKVMKALMEDSSDLCIPTPVEIEYGTRWSEMEAI